MGEAHYPYARTLGNSMVQKRHVVLAALPDETESSS